VKRGLRQQPRTGAGNAGEAPLVWTFNGRFTDCLQDMEDTLQPGALVSNWHPHELRGIDKVFFRVEAVDRCWHRTISYRTGRVLAVCRALDLLSAVAFFR
jgi:hypothetical protein